MTAAAPRARASVRVRLALAHAALLGVLVLALAVLGVWYVERTLLAQVDAELAETAGLLAGAFARADGAASPAGAHEEAVRTARAGHLDVLVFDPAARRVVSRTAPLAPDARAATSADWPSLLAAALAAGGGDPAARAEPAVFGVRAGGTERRAAALPVPGAGGATGRVLVAVRDLADVRELVARLWRALFAVLPAVLAAAAGFGYLLARRGLAPVLTMSAQAARISAAAPDARLVPRDPDDELGRMAAAFNALLDRLSAALAQQRHFMADASHELRTPAAVVRAAADVALRRGDRSAAEYRQALEIARDEAERLARIVDDLFLLARADAGQPTLRPVEFYLDDVLADCARAMRAVADERGIALAAAFDGAEDGDADDGDAALDEGAPVRGDEALVRRLVLNLLDNALKYTPAGGRVTLRLAADELRAPPPPDAPPNAAAAAARPAWRVEVEDTGPGVPPEDRPRIFDRFFRGVAPLTRGGAGRSGAGLGLAMARAIAEAHGGRLELVRSDAGGSVFAVVLPHDAD